MLERLFNTHQIADLLGTDEAVVDDWIKKGWLPVRDSPGEQVCISEKGLVQFLKSRGIDMEAMMAGIAPDNAGEQLPEPVSPAEPLAPPLGREQGRTAVQPEEPPAPRPFDGAQGRRQGREQGRTSVPPAEPVAPTPEEPPRKGRPQGTLTPQRDRVSPTVTTEEVEHSESHPSDPAAQVADALLRDAAAKRVTHIHLDSCRDELSLRVRIDGLLHDKPNFKSRLPKGLGPRLVAHLKTLAGLEVGEIAHPQTGSFRLDINGVQEDFRLATHPTVHGERLVIHVRLHGQDTPTLDGIGLGEDDLSSLRAMLAEPCGLILVVGLPGSGPATMLRAMLAEVGATGRDVVALETRSQFPLEGISRCRIDHENGVADTLQSLRNQDVDAILIDDIPSRDAAVGAVEAAIDGRLVLAGVFARNPAVAMEMLLESAKPWTLASALLTVIHQRTVRKICPKCRQEIKPPANLSLDFPVYRGAGCDECSQTGYIGRTGLFSMLHVDGIIAAILRNNDNAGQIISSAAQAGIKTLHQAGLKKVRAGITSLEELSRVLR